MKDLKVITNSNFEERLANYPDKVKPKMDFLRNLIIETAKEIEGIDKIEKTLKWNEPSFIIKYGST